VVGSFDASVDTAVSFDNSRVAAISASWVGAFLYFFNCCVEGVVESMRGKNPPGW
jgi:hypothetical protein